MLFVRVSHDRTHGVVGVIRLTISMRSRKCYMFKIYTEIKKYIEIHIKKCEHITIRNIWISEETSGISEESSGISEESSGNSEETSGISEETSGISEETSGIGEETSGISEESSENSEESIGIS